MSESTDKASLHWILKYQNKNEILEFIQEKNIELKETSKDGDTVLHLILQNENLNKKDIIELLEDFFNQGVDPNTQNKEKLTVLHLAIEKRWRDVIELLMRCNMDILERDKDGNSLAHYFIANEKAIFCKFLKSEPDDYFTKSVVEMEKFESTSFVEFMVSKGFDFDGKNNKGESALHLSINYNFHHILLVLLKYTQQIHDVDSSGQTLLHLFFKSHPDYRMIDLIDEPVQKRYAAYRSRYVSKLVKLLLDRGVCVEAVDDLGNTCIQAAIEVKEDKVLMDYLMKRCTQSNFATRLLAELFKSISCWDESRTDYFLATSHALIKQGANVNAQIVDLEGVMSLLYYVFRQAKQCAHLRAVKFLNEHRADFSALTAYGENLFHALATVEHDDCTILNELFELVVSKSCCDVNARNEDGDTPLHLACECGYLAIVQKLLKYGAEVNCQNESGETPLHCITDHNDELAVELAECLLKNGADATIKDNNDKRPLFYVADTERSPLVSVLLKWKAYANICDTDFQIEDLVNMVECVKDL